MSALLVAMSVGASIVIAHPDDLDPAISANVDEKRDKTNKSASLMRRARLQAKGFALKTIEFGKELTFKAANATADITDRIGDTISHIRH